MCLALVYIHQNVEIISLLYPHLPGLVSQNLNTTTSQLDLPVYFPTLSLLTYQNFSTFYLTMNIGHFPQWIDLKYI